jgi:hypothetical protein
MVRIGSFRITRKVKVERIEYVTGAPSILPIFRTPTAIVIDLSDPDYAIIDPKTGKVWALDGVVRDIVSATVQQTIVSDFLTGQRLLEERGQWWRCLQSASSVCAWGASYSMPPFWFHLPRRFCLRENQSRTSNCRTV